MIQAGSTFHRCRLHLLTIILAGIAFHSKSQALDIHKIVDSDLLVLHEENYRYDPSWLVEWYAHDSGVRASAGSISSKRFYFDLDARFQADLTDHLRFGYEYRQYESFLWDRDFHLADLTWSLKNAYAGITGMVEYREEVNVLGLVMGYRNPTDGFIDLRWVWRGLYFNSKGPQGEEYITDPMDIHLNSFLQWKNVRLMAHLVYGNRWELADTRGRETSRKSDGFIRCEYLSGSWSAAVEFSGMDYSFSRTRDTAPEMRSESVEFHSVTLEYGRQLSRRNSLVLRAGRFAADGDDDYEEDSASESVPHFTFERSDLFASMEWFFQLTENSKLAAGIIGGAVDVETDDPTLYDQYDRLMRWKLMSEYHYGFRKNSTLTLGLSYNVSESRFGGGNFRIQVFI